MAEPIKIYANEAGIIAPNLVRAPGTYQFPAEMRGNATVSTVWVEDIDGGTITATWKDHNPFTQDLFTVAAHAPITTNGYHRKFIAEAMHGVSVLEVVVTGGSPKFGVFATANQLVGNFASPDSVQEVSGEVSISDSAAGAPAHLRSDPVLQTTPNDTVTVASGTVPVGKVWKIYRLEGQCRAYGYFEAFIGATRIARSNTNSAANNAAFAFAPYDLATAGETVELKFTQSHGPAMDLSGFLLILEDDA